VPAHPGSISRQPRRTALRRGDAEVHTCEHLLAAAFALGVDNLLIELDAAELPGCDGSARDFVDLLESAGLAEQDEPRRELRLERTCSVVAEKGSIIALPYHRGLRVTYVFAPRDGAFGGPAVVDVEVTADRFVREIAPARTFVTLREAELARAAGLGLGANFENTLIWDGERLLNNRFRFDDEPARHKVLDVIGDLALASRPLTAHVIAQGTGHWENLALLGEIEAVARASGDFPSAAV
jgi:UDP-3-O-acyl-N-acetylglucosamine deacetylase